MQIILLSGGSGSRLWPLSNESRSKQFLRLFKSNDSDDLESMVQRTYKQLLELNFNADITIATSTSQKDSIIAQLGNDVDIITEPYRRNTFPAIALACEYLSKKKHCTDDEIVIVMPCDTYTQSGYFNCIKKMANAIQDQNFDLIVMGITPTYPSPKYGYIVPDLTKQCSEAAFVKNFIEKPDNITAASLISDGALWNGGVFAFRLKYLLNISALYNNQNSYESILKHYDAYPHISFDYEVAEKATSIGVIRYDGNWKDLGTWNTLADELSSETFGNVITDGTSFNTHIINELNIPILCVGTENLVVAASPDGIIVAEKSKCESIKDYIPSTNNRPMFEERRWGTYKVLNYNEFPNGHKSLTKQITIMPNYATSYHRHMFHDEVLNIIHGNGVLIINDEKRSVTQGETIVIPKGVRHAIKAITTLSVIDVQSGSNITEEDIEHFSVDWD